METLHTTVGGLVTALKRCTKTRDLENGKRLHQEAATAGCAENKYIVSALVTMYSRCGEMTLARQTFNRIDHRDVVTWNSLVLGYVDNGQSFIALDLFSSMDSEPDPFTYAAALKACRFLVTKNKFSREFCVAKVTAIHKHAKEHSSESDLVVRTALVDVYSRCGCLLYARQVFDTTSAKDVVAWNALILGYVENGDYHTAIELYLNLDCEPSLVSFIAGLKACTKLAAEKESAKEFCLKMGIDIHKHVRERGLDSDLVISNLLVDMYGKCRRVQAARDVFNMMSFRNAVAWNCLILGYVANGQCTIALDVFNCMDCEPDPVTYIAKIKAWSGLLSEKDFLMEQKTFYCLEKGISIHKEMIARGVLNSDSDAVLETTLLDMYTKCSAMKHARKLFDNMSHRNVATWTALILGYVENGEHTKALELFVCFTGMNLEPDSFMFVSAFKACGSFSGGKDVDREFCLEKGVTLHKQAKIRGLDNEVSVKNALVDMYSRCTSMHHGREVFDGMSTRTVVSWTSLMLGYIENHEYIVAIDLFTCMECEPSSVTYVAVLKAWGGLASENTFEKEFCLVNGVAVHKDIRCFGFDSDIIVSTALVDMYSRCGSTNHAKAVFDNMASRNAVTWTTLLVGYVENGESMIALNLFSCMDSEACFVTYIAALKACGELASEFGMRAFVLRLGIAMHIRVKESGFDSEVLMATVLLDMYTKCGSMIHARAIFDGMSNKDAVTWTSLILGYTENGQSKEALVLFSRMDCKPSSVTFVAAIKACGCLTNVSTGRRIHYEVSKVGADQEQVVGNALMDMYVKCGKMARARELFNRVVSPDRVSWNTLIAGYNSIGDSRHVFSLLAEMEESGFQMNYVTFTSLLSACSHAGLLKKAKRYFDEAGRHGIKLCLEHYNCMVDVLSRANRLEEALAFIRAMPFEGDSVTWMTLLAACRKWKNLEVGKVAFDAVIATGSKRPAAYILMSDIYALRDVAKRKK